jgi:hypothetical protein
LLSLVSTTEELLERKRSGSGLENLDYGLGEYYFSENLVASGIEPGPLDV